MIKPAAMALLLAPLALAACSSEPAETTETGGDVPVAESTPGEAMPFEEGIPAAMLGVWDYVEGTCDPASDLRLEIAADQLVFYESVGTVRSAVREGDDVTVALAMEGEGDTWEDVLTFRLVEGGSILESHLRDPSGNGLLRRKRCEG